MQNTLCEEILSDILVQPEPTLMAVLGKSEGFALWVRMLSSRLVEADFLHTEALMAAGQALQRANTLTPPNMLPRFGAYMEAQFSRAAPTPEKVHGELKSGFVLDCLPHNAALSR